MKILKVSGLLLIASFWFNGCTHGPQQRVVDYWDEGQKKLEETFVKQSSGDSVTYRRYFHRDGSLWMEGPVAGDKRHGLWKAWYADSTLWSEGEFEYGIRNGISNSYYENGQVRYRGFYKNGVKTGIWKFWKQTGLPALELDLSDPSAEVPEKLLEE